MVKIFEIITGYCPETDSKECITINYTDDQYHKFINYSCKKASFGKCNTLKVTGHCPLFDSIQEEKNLY